nr:OmpA family protein [Micromonospora sp. DSM 115978]
MTAAGGTVEFVPSTSDQPPSAVNEVPPVPVPDIEPPVVEGDVREVSIPSSVLFFANSAELLLPDDARRVLRDEVVSLYRSGATVRIVGHTADDGSGPGSGVALSQQRADVVRDVLVDLGLPAEAV